MAGRRTLETILLDNKLVSAEQLQQITRYAQAIGIDLYEAVLQKKIAPPDAVMMAYAESIGLPFVYLSDISINEELVVRIDPITARQYSFVPISADQGFVLLAATKPIVPDVEEELRMIFNMPVRCAICAPAELNEVIAKYYPRGTTHVKNIEREVIASSVQPKATKSDPMSDEEIKNRFQLSVVAFNFSVFFVCVGLYFLRLPRGIHNTLYQFPLLALIGMAIGGIIAFVTWKKMSR